jgi:hypothetical protein
MQIGLGLGLTLSRGGEIDVPAPDYEEPDEVLLEPPTGEPVAPDDTPIDPATDEPVPGFDPDFVMPGRIVIDGDKRGVSRSSADANTWAVAYVATALTGAEYFEVTIHPSTPRNATMAIGISTLDMPLNGIPGELPGTIAYWSDGRVRQDGATIATLATWGRSDLLGIAMDGLRQFLAAKNCAAISAPLGSFGSGTLYPFVALFSTGAQARFNFASSDFVCTVPEGVFPVAQVDLGTVDATSIKIGAVLDDGVDYTDAAKLSALKIGAVLREV